MTAGVSAAGSAGQGAFAGALLDPDRSPPSGLRSWNGSDVDARFAVHRNNVVSSLVDALATTFEVVAELVGDDFFRAMAGRFVRQSPPAGPVLALYGEGFPDFIAGFEPAGALPYLADVARLEYLRLRAAHGADRPPVDASAIERALASGERLPQLRIALHPSVAAIASRCAIASIWGAHQAQRPDRLAAIDPLRAEAATVLRDADDAVLVLPCTPADAAFVEALRAGQPLGQAAARAIDADPAFDLGTSLGRLFHHAAITAIDLPSESPP